MIIRQAKRCGRMPRPALLWSVLALAPATAALAGDEVNEASINLRSSQDAINRLAPADTSGFASFLLDAATTVCIQIVAVNGDQTPHAGLITSVEIPGGQMITPTNVATFGGMYGDFVGDDVGDGPLVIDTALPGHHYLYLLPFQGPGTYTIHFEAPGITDDVAVVTEVITDSPVAVNVAATETVVTVGTTVVLAATVFEDATPHTAATVTATITPPDLNEFAVGFVDDGQDADDAAGDGLYTSTFDATDPGQYLVTVTVQGDTIGGGEAFMRSVTTSVEAVLPGANFAGQPFSDAGEDDNGNGLFERLVVEAPVDIAEADSYGLTVWLRTQGDQVLQATGQADLLTGQQTITASIAAELLRQAGEDGPYVIESAELIRLTSNGVQPAALLEEGTQQTQAYLLTQFERPAVELTGQNADVGIDDDMDGDFDMLSVSLGIRVITGGTYEYSTRLVTFCGSEIEFVAGSVQLTGGGEEQLELTFDGSLIGVHGADGPYAIRDLVVFSSSGSLVDTEPAKTTAYTADQFDAFTTSDCNGNLEVDACEVFVGAAPDCNGNFKPDECDISAGTSQDCNADNLLDDCPLDDTFKLDDGTPEASTGFTNGGDVIWLNQFNVVPGGEVIREISLVWGSVPAGTPTTLMVYDDPNNDGMPADAVLLTTAEILSQTTSNNVFTRVPIAPTLMGSAGDSFFIGANMIHGANALPAGRDTNSGSQQRSWFGGSGTPGGADIVNLANNPSPMRLIDDIGFPGNWLLRARTISDCNLNSIPDQCEPDCNGNIIADACDIAAGLSQDCNTNGTMDLCEITSGAEDDINQNGLPDSCEDCAAPLGSGNVPPLGNLDEADYEAFSACLLGPAAFADPGCGEMDLDGNCRVDLVDFAAFQRAFGEVIFPLGGACCFNDGSCSDEPDQAACDAGGGSYLGDVTSCGTSICPATEACCFGDGSCDDQIPDLCTAAGGLAQGETTECATTACPFGEYSNTTNLAGGFSFFGPGGAGFAAISDDLTLAGELRDLVFTELAVFGNGGGPFDVTASLFTACPDGGGAMIPGTEFTWTDVPDGGAQVLSFEPASVTIPDTVWMRVTFSTTEAGWILADQAEVGSTANTFGMSPGLCNAQFSPPTVGGFYARLICE